MLRNGQFTEEDIKPLMGFLDDDDSDLAVVQQTKSSNEHKFKADIVQNAPVGASNAIKENKKQQPTNPLQPMRAVQPVQPVQPVRPLFGIQGKRIQRRGPFYKALLKGLAPDDAVDVKDLVRSIKTNVCKCLIGTKQGQMWMHYEKVKEFYPARLIDYMETRIRFRDAQIRV